MPKDKNDLLKGWCEYFDSLLNNKNKNADQTVYPVPSPNCKDIKTAQFNRSEIEQAIEDLKRNKAPGPDYAMTAEVLKDGDDFIVDELLYICQMVYENCHAPTQWTSNLIIPLPKKGNRQLMTN